MRREMVLTALFFVVMNGLNYESVIASDISSSIYAVHPNDYPGQLHSLTTNQIESAEIMWLCCNQIPLTKDEINTLVTLLKKVQKNEISPYTGPGPKGGPRRINLYLKSNEQLTFVLNGDGILLGRNQIYLPEIREFVENIWKQKLRNAQISD
ncbi:hypothetical protein [Paenibacillus lignilyticus]|uniref:Uncharacterized protein n=1 Tax=Paenibacillus lignilyticus TaxID=1172615 RepID=A0ABS5CKZ1_9BACL|nr:hypothetical protein [Paenibacillus lignilyticus]MBP3966533.1 hypothetical protein [Paenibacillus lignilyticus]